MHVTDLEGPIHRFLSRSPRASEQVGPGVASETLHLPAAPTGAGTGVADTLTAQSRTIDRALLLQVLGSVQQLFRDAEPAASPTSETKSAF